MTNREFNETRTKLLMELAEAGRAALEFQPLAASALAAIPNTEPPKYVVAGTLQMIAKMLPTLDVAAPAVQAHAQNAEEVRRAALEEAAEACMRASPNAALRRAIGDSAHYVACRDAIRSLASKEAAAAKAPSQGGEQ